MVSLAPLLSADNAARRAAEAAFDEALEREPDAAANSLAATLDPAGFALQSAAAAAAAPGSDATARLGQAHAERALAAVLLRRSLVLGRSRGGSGGAPTWPSLAPASREAALPLALPLATRPDRVSVTD